MLHRRAVSAAEPADGRAAGRVGKKTGVFKKNSPVGFFVFFFVFFWFFGFFDIFAQKREFFRVFSLFGFFDIFAQKR